MTVFLKSYGCRLNQAEGWQLEAALENAGVQRVPFGDLADIIIVNSCTVTRKAETECLKFLQHIRATQPQACIVLTGCATETCTPEALRGIVDVVVPQAEKDNIVPLVMRHLGKEFIAPETSFRTPRTQRAALKVQDGCAFACAYCVVPIARGNVSRSRPFNECLAEARALIENGFQEIVVTGCNTACYQDEGKGLVDLLSALLQLPGRVRLGSIEPETIERDIIRLMQAEPKLCRFLHLPIQSGDDETLKRMRRRYTIDSVMRFLDEAYQLIPDISIGTDLIVGFPGETEAAFANSRKLIESYPFSNVHVFPYSERPKTAAAEMPNQVALTTRKQRARTLIQTADEKRLTYMQRFIGRPVTLLIERYDPQGRACGWSAEYLPCAVSGLPKNLRRTLHTFTPTRIQDGVLAD